jgi:5-methylcytosine-specific restriction endonuclease McrA
MENKYLGKLCPMGHDYFGTGKSLRRSSNRSCCQCSLEDSKIRNRKRRENSDYRIYERRYKEAYRSDPAKYAIYLEGKRKARRTVEGRLKAKGYKAKRRGAKKIIGFTARQLRERFSLFYSRCAYCNSVDEITVDHFISLAKGGFHCIENIFPACKLCNSSKNSNSPIAWYKNQKFFCQEQLDYILSLL